MKVSFPFTCPFCEKKFTRMLSCYQWSELLEERAKNPMADLCGSCRDDWRRDFLRKENPQWDEKQLEDNVRHQAEEDKERIGRGGDE